MLEHAPSKTQGNLQIVAQFIFSSRNYKLQ